MRAEGGEGHITQGQGSLRSGLNPKRPEVCEQEKGKKERAFQRHCLLSDCGWEDAGWEEGM